MPDMSRVIVSPRADRDLDDCADYLARRASLQVARRFLAAAAQTFESLAGMPGIGSAAGVRSAAGQELRLWTVQGFRNHVIIYRPLDDGIEVARVIHGSRDLGRVLTDLA
jgi:toxin ParE1/3/4